MSEDNVPDPFASAKRAPGIRVVLRPENVTNGWVTLTHDEATRLLERHAPMIASEMLAAGIEAAYNLARKAGGPK
jgi:hypothetical protein